MNSMYKIKDRKQLKYICRLERAKYPCLSTVSKTVYARLCHDRDFFVCKYLKLLRTTEYYDYKRSVNPIYMPLYIITKCRKNSLGERLNLDMGENAFDEGLFIAHKSIIVGSSTIGKNCILHGQNCIGSGAVIGDDCEMMVGAKIFGPAHIGNNVTVAAGAVVVKNIEEDNVVIAGVPARIISYKREEQNG